MIDNKTKKETFMGMAEVQAGLGFGVKNFRLVWVFDKKADLDRFINSGWELMSPCRTGDNGSGWITATG